MIHRMRSLTLCLILLVALCSFGGCGSSNSKLAGNFSMTLKNYDEAVVHYKAALKDNPDSVPLLTGLGRAYYNLGEYDKAAEAFKGITEIQPGYPSAVFYQGLCAIAKGDRAVGFDILTNFRYPGKVYVTNSVRDMAKRLEGNSDATSEYITQTMFKAWDDGMDMEQDVNRSR